MVNSKDFRKGIRQLEWEHRKMKMTIEDYIQKQRDITYLKLTREVQEVRLCLQKIYEDKCLKTIFYILVLGHRRLRWQKTKRSCRA